MKAMMPPFMDGMYDEGSANKEPWMKAAMHGDVRRFCRIHGQQKVRGHGQ